MHDSFAQFPDDEVEVVLLYLIVRRLFDEASLEYIVS